MKERILEKSKLTAFLDGLLEQFAVIAPVKEGDMSLYKTLEKGADLCLDYIKPKKSAKEIFFPQNEVMFYFNKDTQKAAEPVNPERDAVLFGATSCDLAGIAAQDRIFASGAYEDYYYKRRRERTVIIGMGCLEPGDECFCNFFGIDRLQSEIADLFFVPLGDVYYIHVNSENGEALVKDLPEALDADNKALEEMKNREVTFAVEAIPLEDLAEVLPEHFNDLPWDDIARGCIGCATCTFVCPTCHCFDITDEVKGSIGRRVRTWDGCMFPKFTLHASGHNPRTNGGQRMRQRVLHKFSYFRDNQGCISCTGCGRCIVACPVGMDLRETLKRLQDAACEKA